MARKTHDVLSVDWIPARAAAHRVLGRSGLFSRMDPWIVLA